jgi:transcriptional regulator with XRE-family HTH domain
MDTFRLDENAYEAFCGALRRALRVAARNDEGERTAVSQSAFAKSIGVDRNTLATYLTGEGAGKITLKSIAQIADLLGVPPALLLMRRQDWVVLLTSMAHLAEIFQHRSGEALFQALGNHTAKTLNPIASAKVGIEWATLMGVGPNTASSRGGKDAIDLREALSDQIATNCALPPYNKLNDEHTALALALCALIGSRPRPPNTATAEHV